MNIRDDRTIGEQVRSGLRLTGWILLTLAFVSALALCTVVVLNSNHGDSTLFIRVLGACGLIAASVVMFVSTSYWAKWFVGFLGYSALRVAVLALLRPHEVLYIQLLLLFIFALVLCARCILNRSPHNVEKVGLVALVLSLLFSLVLDSAKPFLGGVSTLALAQLAFIVFKTVSKRGLRENI